MTGTLIPPGDDHTAKFKFCIFGVSQTSYADVHVGKALYSDNSLVSPFLSSMHHFTFFQAEPCRMRFKASGKPETLTPPEGDDTDQFTLLQTRGNPIASKAFPFRHLSIIVYSARLVFWTGENLKPSEALPAR